MGMSNETREERMKRFLTLLESNDDGLRLALVELDAANWVLEARAKAAEAKVARVEALADEWLRNDRDADPWYWSDAGEELRAALDSPADPADIQPDEADIAHRAAMHD